MVFKKEIRISSKRTIKGKIAQRVGLIFIISGLLPSVIGLLPEGPMSMVLGYLSLASFVIAFLSIFYFIFFYKSSENKTNMKTSLEKTEPQEIVEEQNNENKFNSFFTKNSGLGENRHKFPFFVFVILILVISGIIFFFFVENNQKKLLTQCARQAEIVLENEQKNKLDPNDIFTQTNHYNNVLKKCLVKIQVSMTINDSMAFQTDVRDAFEGKSFIVCYLGTLNLCVIPADASSSGEPIKMDNAEGERIIKDYMDS